MRRAAAVSLVFLLPLGSTAQEKKEPARMRLALAPAAAPSPALRYKLLPEVRERKPGNAAVLYFRAFAPEWAVHNRPEVVKQLEPWWEDPRKAPAKELHWVKDYRPLREIDAGARREYCDWQWTERLRKEGFLAVLPDAQGFRSYASLLALRARLEMLDGHFDKAVHSLQTGLTLGRDLADGPSLIHGLIGLAFGQLMLEQAEEMTQLPGSPNLYWALTELPSPFVSLRNPLEGERLMADALFPGVREILNDPARRPLSVDEIRRYLDRLKELKLQDETGVRLTVAWTAARLYPEGKRYLLARGWTADRVAAMPVTQVGLMYSLAEYDRLFDEFVKWHTLPYGQAAPGLRRAEDELKRVVAESRSRGNFSFAGLFLPAVDRTLLARARLDRRIAALRCIEAIRLHAAANGGKLPASLAEVREVPIPIDPLTGKAFEYTVRDGTARLSSPVPVAAGLPDDTALRYELTVRRPDSAPE